MAFDCVYASASWGLHDLRWTNALRELGHEPAIVVLDRDADAASFHDHVAAAAHGSLPVLAGPLTTVTRLLTAGPDLPRVVGLSWGFDLHQLQQEQDVAWLATLSGLIVDSEPTRRIALESGMRKEQLTYLPWGVDLEQFNPAVEPMDLTSLGLRADARVVLSLRAHEPLYRVGEIIEAFALAHAEQDDLVLLVGHSGSLTRSFQAQVARLKLDEAVLFIDSVEEPQVARLLRAASCYVTAAEVDGTSVTLLQAMACGTPVVASDSPGNLDWISPVTGYLFHMGSITQLHAALVQAMSSDTSRRTDAALALVRARADWHANLHRLHDALFD